MAKPLRAGRNDIIPHRSSGSSRGILGRRSLGGMAWPVRRKTPKGALWINLSTRNFYGVLGYGYGVRCARPVVEMLSLNYR